MSASLFESLLSTIAEAENFQAPSRRSEIQSFVLHRVCGIRLFSIPLLIAIVSVDMLQVRMIGLAGSLSYRYVVNRVE
jgi:hypothetical protein